MTKSHLTENRDQMSTNDGIEYENYGTFLFTDLHQQSTADESIMNTVRRFNIYFPGKPVSRLPP